MLKIGKGKPPERNDWELILKLKTGEFVEVDDREQWSLAQRRAHDIAAREHKKFTSKWIKVENVGRIWRVD